jgi:hypothetical protein
MISLMQYILDFTNFCKIDNLLTYSLFFGVILYVLIYLYMILYEQEFLSNLSWWMISIVFIDLSIAILYYFSLSKQIGDFTTNVEDSEDLTLIDEDEVEEKNEQDFITNDFEKEIINDIVENAEELNVNTPEMSLLKEIEKEMNDEFQKQIVSDLDGEKSKPKTKKKKKQEIKDVEVVEI